MKRVGNIYEKIIDKENIRNAIKNACKGKTYRLNVAKVLNDTEYYVDKIQEMLKNKSYIPSEYAELTIKDGSNHKERIIFKPKFFPDQ